MALLETLVGQHLREEVLAVGVTLKKAGKEGGKEEEGREAGGGKRRSGRERERRGRREGVGGARKDV